MVGGYQIVSVACVCGRRVKDGCTLVWGSTDFLGSISSVGCRCCSRTGGGSPVIHFALVYLLKKMNPTLSLFITTFTFLWLFTSLLVRQSQI
jgi:hypothetical protein